MTAISATVESGTPQQEALENGAAGLLVMLDEYVPGNVAHYAVEDLRRTLKQYLRLSTPSVTTRDAQADWNAMQTQVAQSPEQAAAADREEAVLRLIRENGYGYSNSVSDPETADIISRLVTQGLLRFEGYNKVVPV